MPDHPVLSFFLYLEKKPWKLHVQTALISYTALASRPLSPAWPKNSTELSYWKTTFHKRLTKARKQTWGREEGVWSYSLLYELIISKTFLISEPTRVTHHMVSPITPIPKFRSFFNYKWSLLQSWYTLDYSFEKVHVCNPT